jgi:hydroxypyruvate reductase
MSDAMQGHSVAEIALVGTQRPEVIAALERSFKLHRIWEAPDPLAALRAVGPRIRGAASHGMAGLPSAYIDLLPNLEICAINGVGLETTDLAKCRQRGITVTVTPMLYDDVADLAIALALAACRRVVEGPHRSRGRTASRGFQGGYRIFRSAAAGRRLP